MEQAKDYLDEIFVDNNEPADKKLIVDILKRFATIDKNGVIDFKEDYGGLSYWKKILIYLTCKKAMSLRGIISEEETGPKEISEKAGISESVAKKIANNFHLKKLTKRFDKGYLIPNYNLKNVKKSLEIKEDNLEGK